MEGRKSLRFPTTRKVNSKATEGSWIYGCPQQRQHQQNFILPGQGLRRGGAGRGQPYHTIMRTNRPFWGLKCFPAPEGSRMNTSLYPGRRDEQRLLISLPTEPGSDLSRAFRALVISLLALGAQESGSLCLALGLLPPVQRGQRLLERHLCQICGLPEGHSLLFFTSASWHLAQRSG